MWHPYQKWNCEPSRQSDWFLDFGAHGNLSDHVSWAIQAMDMKLVSLDTAINEIDKSALKHGIRNISIIIEASGVARTSLLLGHSMGTLRLYELARKAGHLPPKNLGILQPSRSVLRPYTIGSVSHLRQTHVWDS